MFEQALKQRAQLTQPLLAKNAFVFALDLALDLVCILKESPAGIKEIIMQIQAGAAAPLFQAEDMFGDPIDLRDYADTWLLLSFFRNAACAICNLRVHQLIPTGVRPYKIHRRGAEAAESDKNCFLSANSAWPRGHPAVIRLNAD
jgi:hypothetical protein